MQDKFLTSCTISPALIVFLNGGGLYISDCFFGFQEIQENVRSQGQFKGLECTLYVRGLKFGSQFCLPFHTYPSITK